MIKAIIIYLALTLSALSQTSDVVTVKAWTRDYIMGILGGGLIDPTGSVADGQRSAAAVAMAEQSGVIVAGAAQGLTNALDRLYDVAGNTNKFTGRMYLAADLDSDPGYDNVESYVIKETHSPSNIIYYVHYTRLLNDPPKTLWNFAVADGEYYWQMGSINTNNETEIVNGYNCYKITVSRPAEVGNIVLRTHKYLRWGAPGNPLAIPDAGLELACGGQTNAPYTGSVVITNGANELTESYISGFLLTTTTNVLEGV